MNAIEMIRRCRERQQDEGEYNPVSLAPEPCWREQQTIYDPVPPPPIPSCEDIDG